MIPRFELHRPSALDEAVSLLGELEDATCYAGGTEILQVMKLGFASARHLIDLKRVPGIDAIELDPDGGLRIGATVTHRQLETSPLIASHLPVMVALERQVANVRIRNVGTVGGNLCFAEPHSDVATLLLACEATVTLAGPGSSHRTLALDEFMVDAFTTAKDEAEIMTQIVVPPGAPDERMAYTRFALAERPTISVACRLRVTDDGAIASPRIVVGAVGPRPMAVEAAARLDGMAATDVAGVIDDIGHACAAEIESLDELEIGPAYLANLVAVHVGRAVTEAIGAAA